jgi:hypothetical protein
MNNVINILKTRNMDQYKTQYVYISIVHFNFIILLINN